MTGRITHLQASDFGQAGGWGSIRPDETDVGTVYFASGALQVTGCAFSELQHGDRVEFTLIDHPRGPRALEVRVLRL